MGSTLINLEIFYEFPHIPKAAASLWITNVAGALTGLDGGVDHSKDRIGLIDYFFTFDASHCVSKTITNKNIIVGHVFLKHPFTNMNFQKGLGTVMTVIYYRTILCTAKTVRNRAYFSQWDIQ